jgi:cytochrome c oxidase subunit 4
MSTTDTERGDRGMQLAPEDEEHHEHPSDWKYIQIAIILAVLTAAEVATYYVDLGAAEIPVLLALMVVKFVLVVMWFMHLRFDSPMFTRTFVGGLVLAVAVYIAALATFEFWS